MTAPRPGLTDLIATHTLRVVELNEAARYPECNGCDWVGGLVKDHAVHLASVVEQHTNGRIAELEAAVRKRIQLLREHDGFGAAHADGYMGMNWTAYYEGAHQAQVMAAADLENDLCAALEGEQQ